MKYTKLTGLVGSVLGFSALPLVTFAASDQLGYLIGKAGSAINALIPLVIGLAVLVFLWGVLNYVISKSEQDKSAARSYMIWGLVGLFVMVSVWGLVNLMGSAIFGSARGSLNTPPPAPGIPRAGYSGTSQSARDAFDAAGTGVDWEGNPIF